jgi:hypothetical protein
MQLEGLGQLKNPMFSSGIEPMTVSISKSSLMLQSTVSHDFHNPRNSSAK